MLPCRSLTMSWMLLSCLMLLSQVQGRVFLPLELNFLCAPSAKDQNRALLACQKRSSGHLVSVLSGAEASFVSSMVKRSVNNGQYVWIGLRDPTLGQEPNAGGWEWSNADVMNYLNWEVSPASSSRGYCGSLSQDTRYVKWISNYCDLELPYVCKFKA
ncbi:reproteinrating islet-derived protein 3-gamma-like [Sigmodon hispidus]